MKLSEIVNIESTKGVSTKDLRKMTQQLQDAANKRIKRLMEDPIGRFSIRGSNALRDVEAGLNPFYSMSGVNSREKLVARFKQLRNFINNEKTGSLKAFKKTYQGIVERLKGAPDETFWRAYRELAKNFPDGQFPGGFDSNDTQVLMMNIYHPEEMDAAELYQRTLDKLQMIYEGTEEVEYEEFFDLVDDEEDIPF